MKKWNLKNKYVAAGLTGFIVIACSLIFYYLLFHASKFLNNFGKGISILMPVIFGLVIAFLLAPILNYLEFHLFIPLLRLLKINITDIVKKILRWVSILITMMISISLMYLLIHMIVAEIVPSIANIASNFDAYVDNFTATLNKMLNDNSELQEYAVKMINKYSAELEAWFNGTVLAKSSEILKKVSLGVLGSIKVVWNLVLGLIISIYVLANKEIFAGQLKKIIYALFDANAANIILNDIKFTHKTFSGFISGKILDSFLIGCLCFIGTTIMQTPYAALISVIIGVTNIIPFFGPYLGAIPSVLLIFLVDPMHPLNCVYFALFILVLQQVDGNIIGPKILGESTGLSSFWVIFAITFFGGIWGVFGMLVGVPFFAVVYAAFRSIINTKLRKRNLPTDSGLYTFVCAVDTKGLHEYIPGYKQTREKDGKKTYRFGEKFLSDFEQPITGAYMKREDAPADTDPQIQGQTDIETKQTDKISDDNKSDS